MRSVARESSTASAAACRSRAHEREVGGLDRGVRAGAHREAEVGRGERGGVVDAVADHRDRAARALQPPDGVDLAVGQDAGDDVARLDPDLRRDGGRRRGRCRR